jgi:hypothetical protein
VGGVKVHGIRFRHSGGPVTLQQPKGSQMLRVNQNPSGFWCCDVLAPANATDTEPVELWLLGRRQGTVDLDMSQWSCVGWATSQAGETTYVFHKQPAKRKPGRPKKAAKTPPVDADPA